MPQAAAVETTNSVSIPNVDRSIPPDRRGLRSATLTITTRVGCGKSAHSRAASSVQVSSPRLA